MNINKIVCTGRLTKDPELRRVSEEMSVCQLRLAVDQMGRGREVGFINVSVFGKAAEACAEYLAKAGLSRSTAAWSTASGSPRVARSATTTR